MGLSLRGVDIEVNGQVTKFDIYDNDLEYEIDSTHLGDMSISDCIRALRQFSRICTSKPRIRVDLVIRLVDVAFWERTFYGIFIDDKGGHYNLQFSVHAATGMQEDEISNIVSAHIQGTDFSLWRVRHDNVEMPIIESDGWHGWTIDLRLKSKSIGTFQDLLQLRSRMSQAVFLPSDKLTTPYLILRAIQSGRTESILGISESEFLEVKSAAYDLRKVDETRWKLELAQDVAQFANASGDGLLLIGYRTKKIRGIDIVQKITAVQPVANRLQVYSDVLRSRIHPPIGGLQIGSIPIDENEIIYIYVPTQPEENKPYLISGALIDGCYNSTGISIVRRQGDTSIPVTAQEIHAALVIGRALIRGRGNDK